METTLTADQVLELAAKLENAHPGIWKDKDLEEMIEATEQMNS